MNEPDRRPDVEWSILAGYRGSHAHGTSIDPETDPEFGTDDIDLMHVVVPPRPYYLGLETYGSRGTLERVQGPWDLVAYELRKFVGLLCKGNPNVLSLLWLADTAMVGAHPWLHNQNEFGYVPAGCTPAGARLIWHRERFTRTHTTITAHVGYAHAQLTAMRKDPTNRAYMGERRRTLAQRFGYDAKHAAHLLRLSRMACELVTPPHQMVVLRPDAEELIAVKRGEAQLPSILAEVEERLAFVRETERRLDWPDRVDRTWASEVCASIVDLEWNDRTTHQPKESA